MPSRALFVHLYASRACPAAVTSFDASTAALSAATARVARCTASSAEAAPLPPSPLFLLPPVAPPLLPSALRYLAAAAADEPAAAAADAGGDEEELDRYRSAGTPTPPGGVPDTDGDGSPPLVGFVMPPDGGNGVSGEGARPCATGAAAIAGGERVVGGDGGKADVLSATPEAFSAAVSRDGEPRQILGNPPAAPLSSLPSLPPPPPLSPLSPPFAVDGGRALRRRARRAPASESRRPSPASTIPIAAVSRRRASLGEVGELRRSDGGREDSGCGTYQPRGKAM